MRNRRRAGQRQPCNHREDGGKGHGRDKAEEQVAAHRVGQMHRRHVVTADKRARRVFKRRVCPHQHDCAEADDKGQNVEVAHKPGGVEHAFTRFTRI